MHTCNTMTSSKKLTIDCLFALLLLVLWQEISFCMVTFLFVAVFLTRLLRNFHFLTLTHENVKQYTGVTSRESIGTNDNQ